MAKPPKITTRNKETKKKPDFVAWAIISIVVAMIIAMPVRGRVRGFVVSTSFMERALRRGDWVMVKYTKDNSSFSAGEVVVFQYPAEPSQFRFGRIVATEGQKVQIYEKKVYVDNIIMNDPPTVTFSDANIERELLSTRDFFGPIEVPAGCYFILCDNRDIASDSRQWGELPADLIIGKPRFVYFSWKHDPKAPAINSVFNAVTSFFYNIFHFFGRAGFDRIGKKVV